MNRNLLIFAVILAVLVAIAFFTLRSSVSGKTADLKGHSIKLEIADDAAEQEKGLSGRDSLQKDTGMLFIFDKLDRYSFWMKDMRFPIDIIFLSDQKIVIIFPNVQPYLPNSKTQDLTNYTPTSPANRVLELNAGQAKEFGLKEGDTVKLNL